LGKFKNIRLKLFLLFLIIAFERHKIINTEIMKALVLEEYKKLVYRDVPDPEIKDNEVLVEIRACGICGSDVHGYDGSTGRRIPPIIMGHEAAGVIIRTGRNVKGWKNGDRVTFDSTVYQLDDWYTVRGMYNLSNNREVIGVSPGTYRRNGAFAQLLGVPEHILYRIPDNVTFEQASLVEAAAVALHAVITGAVQTGDKCLVTGAGTIGLLIIKLLKISGASKIFASDTNIKCAEKALRAGADIASGPADVNLEKQVLDLTGGRGADISFEAVGSSDSVNFAIRLTRRGGKVVLVGNTSPLVDFPLQKVVTSELKILGSCAIRGEYEAVLDLISSGQLNVDDQVIAMAPLKDGAEWFRKLYNKETEPGKVILVP
jgi:2-desacetyl-2-hydroxyethyl bacteriochlorophyllide A dehydrogenase